MKLLFKQSLGVFVLLLAGSALFAQAPEVIRTESSDPAAKTPLDGVVEKTLTTEKRVLPYAPVREADYYWEKRIWRVIDTREKMNHPFINPDMRFFTILLDAAINGEITVYSTEDDRFTRPLHPEEVAGIGSKVDTVITFDPETYEEIVQIVNNELNPDDVKRFRLKEVWYFDKEKSEVRSRILGIAPLMNSYDDNGNFRFELPLFWVYYPDARYTLAQHVAFRTGNDTSPLTWEDIMEMRFFSSYVIKDRNVLDRRLEDIYSGLDVLMEGEKIKQEIFNYEHDLWSF
ncbi:MAG: gliding motility protein GldN [Saprospiraceae bacterium]|nr:gliding motility protein GldN [Saprospiraceae bacterium]